jgi:spermidine synthase
MVQAAFAFVVFLSSACGMVMEIVAGRLIAPYVGMSLYTWTAIIAVVLAGLSLGHWIGGVLAAPEVDARAGAGRVAKALALAAISSLASLVLLRAVSALLLESGAGPITVIIGLAGALFFLPSMFVGIVSPILTKLAVDAGPLDPGRIIGRMYALGALGSIAGTLAAGYLFISWIGSTGTVITVSAVYAALALAMRLRLGAGFFALLAVAGGGLFWWGTATNAFQSPCRVESDYFCIRIADFPDTKEGAGRMMILDHLVHSINDRDNPGLLYSPYIHFVDEAAKLRLGPNGGPSAFFIGGGGYSLPRAWANEYGTGDLMVAEIDPAVTKAARDHLWLSGAAPRLKIVHRDARVALQALPRTPTFDVIFGDAFHDITVPAHLVTRQFHDEVAARLKPSGFYAVNVVDNKRFPRFLFSLIKTLRADFKSVEAWITVGEVDAGGRETFVVLASAEPTPAVRIASTGGVGRNWFRWPEDDMRRRLAEASIPILTDDFAPVDRLMSGLILSPEL